MGTAFSTAARGQAAQASVTPPLAFSGLVPARVSSVRADGVRVIVPTGDQTHELGPCIVPIGVQGVGPSTVDTTGTGSTSQPVTFSNAVPLVKGLLVLVLLPDVGPPWLVAIAPTGT